MADEMLVLKDLRKTFNPGTVMRKMALAGVDLTLNKGDFITHHAQRHRRYLPDR